ncbi:type 4 prepilin peptidase 1 [Alsobacter metallidurans]|uniref:Type 4 prepilin peptidase 1 n=1 Tax=Alsobacter metallidurans TaxID=340221 RepID=A0A917MFH1_9HYPH|nr:prepilin peptidase [Alsobacter metallidurans]GGH08552.1 type 4 prepilin peptidase 1 [Alsobacter metallidurans]
MTVTDLALLLLFPCMMAYAACSDLLSMRISNKVSLLVIAAFVPMAIAMGLGWQDWLMHVAAGGLTLVIAFGLFAAGWIGGGDAKLAAATALWLGWGTLLEYAVVSSVFGGVLTLALLQLRAVPLPGFANWPWLMRLHHHKTGIPYGIALAAGALAVYPHSTIWNAAIGA